MDNKKIVNATKKEYKGIKFDSVLEVNCYKLLEKENLDFSYNSVTFDLLDSFRLKTISSYEYLPSRGFGEVLTKKGLKRKIPKMTITPDFYMREVINNSKVLVFIIETKGFKNDVYPYKKRLLFSKLEGIPNTRVYYFEPRNIKEIKLSINEIKRVLNEERL